MAEYTCDRCGSIYGHKPLPDPAMYETFKVDNPLSYLCDWDVISGDDNCRTAPTVLYENPEEADTDYFYLCREHSNRYEEETA